MPISMTRAEYEAKYGASPSIPTSSPAQPVQMTHAEYMAKYGHITPATEQPQQSITDKLLDNPLTRIIQSVFPGRKIGEAIGTLAGYAASPNKDQYDLSAPTPLQVAGDAAAAGLTIAGAKLPVAESVLGKTAQFATLGAGGKAASSIADAKSASETLKNTAKGALVGGATGAAFGLAENGLKALGNFLGKTGDKIQMSVIKPSQADVKDGFSIDTIKNFNLGGSLKQTLEKTDTHLNTLSSELTKKLASSNATVDLNSIYENTAKRLLGNKLENFGANSQMENAIEKLRNEIVNVSGPNGLVSIPEAQTVKRAAGHFGAWTYGVPTPEATANQKVYNTFYNELKTSIEKNSPDGVKEINQKISKLIPVMNAVIRRIPIAERNNALSLTDIISLTGAALSPKALSISLLNLASKSGKIGSLLSKTPALGEAASKAVQRNVEPAIRTIIGR